MSVYGVSEPKQASVPVRKIVTPPRGADGLFMQPRETGSERERDEQHHRDSFANHFHYADPYTGNTRTFDADGNYRCGECNQADGKKCLLVQIEALDLKAGSCDHWEDTCAADIEMKLELLSVARAGYAIAENGEGFGCHRCPFGSKAYQPDSRGREMYCGKGDMRVYGDACCGLNGAKEVPLKANGEREA